MVYYMLFVRQKDATSIDKMDRSLRSVNSFVSIAKCETFCEYAICVT